jgi:hypothetical protein
MAGKHTGGVINRTFATAGGTTGLLRRPIFPGTRPDRAYADGRRVAIAGGSVGSNPFSSANTPDEYYGWVNGFAAGTSDVQVDVVQTHAWNNPELPNP